MARSNRIKEVRLSKTMDGATTDTTVFDSPVNGEILQVEWRANRTGSLAISVSGAGEEFFRRNAPSGTGTQFTVPTALQESTTGSVIDGLRVPFIANGPIVLDTTGIISGTQVYDIVVRYR